MIFLVFVFLFVGCLYEFMVHVCIGCLCWHTHFMRSLRGPSQLCKGKVVGVEALCLFIVHTLTLHIKLFQDGLDHSLFVTCLFYVKGVALSSWLSMAWYVTSTFAISNKGSRLHGAFVKERFFGHSLFLCLISTSY